jgi:hypothetical protein
MITLKGTEEEENKFTTLVKPPHLNPISPRSLRMTKRPLTIRRTRQRTRTPRHIRTSIAHWNLLFRRCSTMHSPRANHTGPRIQRILAFGRGIVVAVCFWDIGHGGLLVCATMAVAGAAEEAVPVRAFFEDGRSVCADALETRGARRGARIFRGARAVAVLAA